MGTSALIIQKINDYKYKMIRCHSDGQLNGPHGVGYKLLNCYSDPKKLKPLMRVGDIYRLFDDIEETKKPDNRALYNFREPSKKGANYFSIEEILDKFGFEDMHYLYQDNEWYCFSSKVDNYKFECWNHMEIQ